MDGVVFAVDTLITVSVVANSNGVLSLVKTGAVRPSVFNMGVENDSNVETFSEVAVIEVISVKVIVLPVNAVDVPGYGTIFIKNVSVALSTPSIVTSIGICLGVPSRITYLESKMLTNSHSSRVYYDTTRSMHYELLAKRMTDF